MKLIKPSVEIIEQKPGMQGLYEQIELAARCCYKSEGLIKYDEEGNSTTAKEFVDKVVNVYKHQSVAEHGTVYLFYPTNYSRSDYDRPLKYIKNPYSKVNTRNFSFLLDLNGYYITTNYRVLIENNWLDDLEYICEPTEYHEKRFCVRFICDRGVSHELVRHRNFSFSQESTRYCNYSSDKFGNELTFIIPSWLDIPEERYFYEDQNPFLTAGGTVEEYGYDDDPNVWFESGSPFKRAYVGTALDKFFKLLHNASEAYFDLLSNHTPQQARQVLPNALKTEVIMTGFISDWKHFFSLRDSEKAHPDMIALAKPLHEEFIKRGYLK